jgi:hypothetical protein
MRNGCPHYDICRHAYVTSARVLFVPNRMNFPRRILRERHVWPLTDVEGIEVAAPDYKLDYAGGMFKRLRLSLRSGDTVLSGSL